MTTQRVLESKAAIITGAGGGIGRPTALALARAGARVAVSDIDRGSAEETAASIRAAGGEAIAVAADISQESDWAALVAQAARREGDSS